MPTGRKQDDTRIFGIRLVIPRLKIYHWMDDKSSYRGTQSNEQGSCIETM